MSVTGIRIDSLLHSLKELQNEKQCLEQKLNERKSRAQMLEIKVEQCNAKLTQVKEMHQKLSEMQKVAVQKVQQTQEQVDSLHKVNQSHNSKIQELNEGIRQEKDRALNDIEEFEEKMSVLSSKLMTARKFYKLEALQERIEDTKQKIRDNEAAVEVDSQEVGSLARDMDSLQLTPPPAQSLDVEVPHSIRLAIWSMLEDEEGRLTSDLQRLQEEQQEIVALLQQSAPVPAPTAREGCTASTTA